MFTAETQHMKGTTMTDTSKARYIYPHPSTAFTRGEDTHLMPSKGMGRPSVSDRLYEMNIAASIADRKFIRDRIAAEYLGRYYELVG